MAMTGDDRPLDISPTRRAFGWWKKVDGVTPPPTTPLPTKTTYDEDDELLKKPELLDLSAIVRPKKKRHIVLGELPTETDQELFDLNIADKLGPEPKTLASTRQLHRTTWALLKRFQNAYIEQTVMVAQMKGELAAAQSATEQEALKSKKLAKALKEAKARMREQDMSIEELSKAMVYEKHARNDGDVIVQPPTDDNACTPTSQKPMDNGRLSVRSSVGSSLSEDLAVENDQTDCESMAEDASVFSRSRSPTGATRNADDDLVKPTLQRAPTSGSIMSTRSLAAPRSPQPRPTSSTGNGIGKLFKGLTGQQQPQEVIVTSCSNCRDEPVSMAWETVSVLRDENRELRDRMGEIEGAVEGALDVVRVSGTVLVDLRREAEFGKKVVDDNKAVAAVAATKE